MPTLIRSKHNDLQFEIVGQPNRLPDIGGSLRCDCQGNLALSYGQQGNQVYVGEYLIAFRQRLFLFLCGRRIISRFVQGFA